MSIQKNIRWSLVMIVAWVATAAFAQGDNFTRTFETNKADFVSTGRNSFFVLEPGYQLFLKGMEDRRPTVLVITVLNRTESVDGVETRVVEERETVEGHPSEISQNFFAFSKATSNIYYFGEEVDVYTNDQAVNHPGEWRSGVHGASFGMVMPSEVQVGSRFYQEVAPDVAMDRAEIVSLTETLDTPAGKFENCLKTRETSPLEDGAEYKTYAPGIGLIQDGQLRLSHFGFATP